MTLYFIENVLSYHLILQKDLTHLEEWADRWDMKFNPKKCYVISANRSGTKSQFRYDLCKHILKEVATNPYLGALLSNDGSFTTHIDSTCAEASRTLGFLSRNLKACPENFKAENPGLQLHVQVNSGVCRPNLGSTPDYRHEEI